MIIGNIFHPHLVNGKIFIVRVYLRRYIFLSQIDDNGSAVSNHALHRIDFQITFADVKVTSRQFPVRLGVFDTVHKSQGQTLKTIVVDFRINFFFPRKVYSVLSRTQKAQSVLLFHESDDDTPLRLPPIHPMPVIVKNPILKETIEFVQGDFVLS